MKERSRLERTNGTDLASVPGQFVDNKLNNLSVYSPSKNDDGREETDGSDFQDRDDDIELFARKSQHASHNTFDSNGIKLLDHARILELASELLKSEAVNVDLSRYRSLFPQYAFELECGFNICFYGYGSKRKIVMDFVELLERNNPIAVINGYHPDLQLKNILTIIFEVVTSQTPKSTSPDDIMSEIMALDLSNNVTIVFHNIDGFNIRDEKCQNVFATIASLKTIQIIATIDHIDASLLWDSSRASLFNFAFHEITTFAPYTLLETAFETASLINRGRKAAKGGIRGIKYVLESLTPNARGIYRLLVQLQLKNMQQDGAVTATELHGLEYRRLYEYAAQNLYVTHTATFRTHMTEFFDHEMIISGRESGGAERLFIPFDIDILQQVLDYLGDNDE